MTVMAGVLEAPPAPPRIDRGSGRLPPLPPTGDDGRGDDEPEPRRRRFDNARLAMLVFLSGEIMFFSGMVSAYLVLPLPGHTVQRDRPRGRWLWVGAVSARAG